MSESYSSILDRFRRKKPDTPAAPPPADISSPAPAPERPELLTPVEDTRLKEYLREAIAMETAGNIKGALELYARYKAEFLAIRTRKESSRTPDILASSIATLQERFSARAAEIGVSLPALETPAVPSTLTHEHLKAMAEFFGDMEPMLAPAPDALTPDYVSVMYPATQREADTASGLVSQHPDWWGKPVDKTIVGPATETWGEAYVRSMKAEAGEFHGKMLLTESIQKPDYIDGSQRYGSKEGRESGKDPLLPIIQEVFGEGKNRFNLTWDEITTKLLPKVKERIEAIFTAKELPVPRFEVIMTPAIVNNLQMTLNHPENSSTTTFEWSSTPLLKQDGVDTGHRLMVGDSGYGGAGYVDGGRRGAQWGSGAFRLSVVSAE